MSETEIYEELMSYPFMLYLFLWLSLFMMVICVVVCLVIAKRSKISKKFAFLGLLGMTGVLMLFCYTIAKKNGMSGYCIFLGLFGIYGIIIMAIMVVFHNQRANNVDVMQKEDTWKNEWQQRYDEMREENRGDKSRETEQEMPKVADRGSICLNCGVAIAPGAKECPFCGEKIR